MRLRPRKKPDPAKPESVRPAPEPESIPERNPRSWREFKRQRGRDPVPKMSQAEIEADYARQQAEQRAERARLAAELKSEKARQEATADALYEQFLSESLWITTPENGHRDPRNVKFYRKGARDARRDQS